MSPTLVNLQIAARPNSKKYNILAVDDESIAISIMAPAREGEANKDIREYLSEVLGVKKGNVEM